MYKIEWDKETGGIVLKSYVTPETLGISPRPVFWEELDLLKLNELGWVYPHSQEPLLWACNKQYYYRGEYVFEVKGGNIYDSATVILQQGKEQLRIQPVDVKEMLYRNKDFLFLLESEAIEFIRDTYLQYASANRSTERVASNQLDYNMLLERAEKRSKKKMAIIKEDCDSFDIECNSAIQFLQIILHVSTILKYEIDNIQIAMAGISIVTIIQAQKSHG